MRRSASPVTHPQQPVGAPRGRIFGAFLVVAVVLGLLGLTVWGSGYYLAEPAVRVRDPLHPWLRPSGMVGQSAGIAALLIFVFLWLYPLRKHTRWLRWTGAMARWLDVHVAAALMLPVLAAVHASWRFGGVIGLGYWSMMVVCASGVVGRFLYVRIPRSASGLELTRDEVAAERSRLLAEVAATTGIPADDVDRVLRAEPLSARVPGVAGTLARMIGDEWARRRAARELRRLCESRQSIHRIDRGTLRRAVRLAGREMALTQQVRLLEATQRVFRLWHIAHRPFAVTALVAVAVHVAVAVSMGMTWIH